MKKYRIVDTGKTKGSIKKFNSVPGKSDILTGFGFVNYCDSWRITKTIIDEKIETITEQIFQLPKWASVLMKIRHVIVKPFGLKTTDETDVKMFPIIDQNKNEIILGLDDKHLNFRVSVLIDRIQTCIYTTTVVRYNNFLGRVYFFIIKPFHGLIVSSAMKKQI
jgi:hypothetical protein